ncbi:MAG: DUF1858 domain-containing protein [Candidatus Aminicenantes bacterium]|nr:DUF1858 domain-containing protein [Candidatus Aminicenantes bacterium]
MTDTADIKKKDVLLITPETKLGELFDHYPNLEDVVIDMAPVFKKLRNPVLKKTIGRVTTLRQVAVIGKILVADIVNRLREETGIAERMEKNIQSESGPAGGPPSWFSESGIVQTLDARPLLEKGEHPAAQVLKEASALESGKIYELITPFLPAPLIDKAREKGMLVWSREVNDGETHCYFTPST